MQQTVWKNKILEQFRAKFAQAFFSDAKSIESYQRDFGGLVQSQTLAVFKPTSYPELTEFLQDIHAQELPISLRCLGLSQSGQSLPWGCGVVLDVSALPKTLTWVDDNTICASNSVCFADVCKETLVRGKLLRAYPYNMHLSVGGVLSVGGLGASTFREGIIAAHVCVLTVMTTDGKTHGCSREINPELFEAVLSGAGQFGIILDATFPLRDAKPRVTVFSAVFCDVSSWLGCNRALQEEADYLEAIWVEPLAKAGQAAFCTRFAFEHHDASFSLPSRVIALLTASSAEWSASQSLPTKDYLFRHDGRFEAMRAQGQWEQYHPWYECYLAEETLLSLWPRLEAELLKGLLGENLHVFPVAPKTNRFFMLPDAQRIVTFNLLMPGIAPGAISDALQSIARLEKILQQAASKRYISGYLAQHKDRAFWQSHYGDDYALRCQLKQQYDPKHLLQSAFLPYTGDK